jgi:hypothetical protein
MKTNDLYVDIDGNTIWLGGLDAEERRLVTRLRHRAARNPSWDAFDNYWTVAVPAFYRARGLPRKAVTKTIPWRVGQDLSSRLGIAAGYISPPDYLDDLEELVHFKFPSRPAFCKATRISEEWLRKVLAGGADLSLERLAKGLERIGYRLRVLPAPRQPARRERKRTG